MENLCMEYEQLFSRNLHAELKEKIKGSVFTKVIEDTLVVTIITKEEINYTYVCANFAEKMHTGQITHESVIHDICTNFKTKVMNTFFYY